MDRGDVEVLQGALVVLLRCQVTSSHCPHQLHVLFQEESPGLGCVPGTEVSRVPPSSAPAVCGCAQLQEPAWLQAL